MFPTAGTIKCLRFIRFQLILVLALTGAVEEKDKDTTLKYCLYNNTAPDMMKVGCSSLDLICSEGTLIQIQSISCGMTSTRLPYCDKRTPKNCRAAHRCCANQTTDKSVPIPLKAENILRQTCNNEKSCNLPFDVVSEINDRYHRHYCLVKYNCKQDNLESTGVPVTAIVAPVVLSILIMVLAIGAYLLRRKRNRGKRSASTTNERPPFTQHMNRDSRASNKYETIDISRGSRPNAPNSTDTNAPNSTDRVRHTLRYGSTCISTIDIVDVSKLSPTIERVTSAHLELETDDTYNHIGESAKVYIKNGNFNEQTASNRRDNVLWFTNNIGIGELLQNDVDNMKDNDTDEMPISRNMKCRDTFSFNRYQANYENVELEGPVSEINPYFILEQYDQYDHLGTVQPTGDAYRTSGQSISDSEYNEIRFTKSEVVADPNYGVLCQDIPPEAVENDTTYSHLGDSDVRASAAFTTDYAKVTLEVTN